ncbi:MAG: hypothetical protein PHN16_00810 [Candidatus Omnitrophica bacterium]|jgi:cytochrome c biogenesis protein CcdA|nr:hypothetical protein [Candidatus Omnitrophota bacterium]
MKFLLKRINICLAVSLLALFLPVSGWAAEANLPAQPGPKPKPKLIFFYSPSCSHCIKMQHDVMPIIGIEFKDKISIENRDISDIGNYRMLLGLMGVKDGKAQFSVPLFYMEGEFLNPRGDVYASLREFIVLGMQRELIFMPEPAPLLPYFKSFVPAAIVVAGLSDGINPCAFTVIVFFISFLALQGYRKKELISIGLAFILAVFLTYLCIGLGIFNFLYRFRGFWAVAHLLNIVIGILSMVFGIFAVYDFIEFKRSGSTEKMILQLPAAVKERIHKVVGFFYRKGTRGKEEGAKPSIARLILSALLTGFLVSLLEAVCTGQVYLPAISFVLKSTKLKWEALSYLFLYNIMFILPLILIFILALLGTTSGQFAAFMKKRLGAIKILMAVLFFSLGIYLLWRI